MDRKIEIMGQGSRSATLLIPPKSNLSILKIAARRLFSIVYSLLFNFSRRSSGYGGKAGQPTEDPRNVRSRTFQTAAIKRLLEVSEYASDVMEF